MKIWAHRGCSQMYPENTLLSFSKAVEIDSLTGIELDIQLTKDGYIVVCHDEKVDRTTDGSGELCSYSLSDLKKMKIQTSNGGFERIPTITEVFDLLEDRLKSGLKLNIELKNDSIPYNGMEKKIIDLVNNRSLKNSVIYSSFNALSIERIKQIDPEAEAAIIDVKVSDCLYKLKGGCGADALHPYWRGMDLPLHRIADYEVRAWFAGHLYPEMPTGTLLDLDALEKQGITDVFLNEPERYLR